MEGVLPPEQHPVGTVSALQPQVKWHCRELRQGAEEASSLPLQAQQ